MAADQVSYLSNTNTLFSSTGKKVQVSQTNSAQSGTLTGGKDADELQEQFLKILLTQLQNQNPLDPVKPTEFTNQMALYSSLEQQISMNDKFDKLLGAMQSTTAGNTFAYIGNNAELATSMTVIQNKEANWKYALGQDTKALKLTVLDDQGRKVFEKDMGASSSGTYSLNLKDADLPDTLPDGSILTLKIEATNLEGKSVSADIGTSVTIDGVEQSEDGVLLRAGGLIFDVEDVKKIVKAPSITAAPPETPA